LDGTALALLDGVVGPQYRLARVACEKEIARLLEPEIDVQKLPRLAQEADAVARQVDVERRRELLADRARRQRRRGAGVCRVALDDDDLAGEVGILCKMVGNGRSHRPATNDCNRTTYFRHTRLSYNLYPCDRDWFSHDRRWQGRRTRPMRCKYIYFDIIRGPFGEAG